MGFFNDFGKKTTEATSKLTKEAKLKLKINDNKSKINDLYKEIGKKVYEYRVREEAFNIREVLSEECDKIDTLANEIEEARLEILKLNNKRQCPKCSTELDKNAAFCSKCGERLEEIAEEAPETVPEAEETAEEIKEELSEQENKQEE